MQGIGIVLFTLGGKNLKRAMRGLTEFLDNTVIVNDGKKESIDESKVKKYIKPAFVKYPSACYNLGIRELLKDESIEHIFIVHDTIEDIDDTLFQDYIDVANKTNLKTLYFCSPSDDPRGTFDNERLKINIGKDKEITLNMGTSGDLVYIHKDVFKKVGFFDERFRAAVEWSDFCYRVSQKNLSTPFLWFPHLDWARSKMIVSDNAEMYSDSVEDRIIRGLKLFHMKYKCQISELIDTYSKKDVINKLKNKTRSS